ncbi:MAG: leukotoxin LktA family filamentous adhesin [Methylotenera sp.]|nr:leukotoxin LktA family filamentous adhesin [Methylotenera sp.]MDP2281106.1 leukotoxin LktA family filamentous adhesin [Methylotenera sp.]MDP3061201.1 leukotoxin LktA family filamentous adhesin [Methylotenera sp.]
MKRSVQGFLSRQYLCVLRRCAWENALSHFITASIAVSGSSAFADNITPDGRTQTQLTVSGNVTDITTKTVQGVNAINSFHRFNIGNGQTVNLYLPAGTANLLNLVHDERSYFDGVLNAYKDGRIGGNVYFLNPHGMVVGAGGVLNVGSLTMATPTNQFMDSLISQAGLVNGNAVNNVLSGYIPLTETGLIQVKGRINATNAVTLLAGNIAVDAGAHIIAGPQTQASFADLVNIQGVATASGIEIENGVIRITATSEVNVAGQVAADGIAGTNAGTVDIHAGTNINLATGADVSANGQGIASSGGNVKIYAEGDATLANGARVSANAGTSGNGGFVEFSAKDTVNILGGQLTAGAQNGQAGTVLIDPADVIWTGSGSDSFTNDGTNYQIDATNSIVLTDVVISTRKVDAADNNRANIDTALSIGNSGSITLKAPNITLNSGTKLLANATGAFTAGDITLTAEKSDHMSGFRAVSASTKIDIDGAILKGKNVSLTATSDAGYDWAGDPAELAVSTAAGLSSTLFAGLTGVNLGVAKSTATSEVFIKNNSIIEAQGDGVTSGVLTLTSGSTSKAESLKLGIDAISKNGVQNIVNVGFVWGEVNSKATVAVDSGAHIKAGTLNMSATNKATTDLTVIGISKDATVNAAAVVNKADVQSTASIAAGATIDVKDNISIVAHNENSFTSSATSMALGSGKVGIAVNYSELNTEATASNNANLTSAGLKNLKIEALDDTVKNKSTAGTVAGSSTIASKVIEPVLEAADSVVNKLLGKVAAGPQEFDSVVGASGKPKIGAAVTYAVNTHNATAFIGNNTVVTVADSIVVAAKVNDQRIRTHATASVEGKKDDEKNPGVSLGFGGALALGTFNHNVNAYTGDNAVVTAQHVGVISDISIPYEITWAKWEGLTTIFSKLNANLGIGDGLLSGWSNSTVGGCVGTCVAGSVTWMDFNNVSNAYIGRNAKVNITPGGSDTWNATLTGDSSAFVGTNSTTIPQTVTHTFLSPVHVLAKSDVQGVYVAGNMSLLLNGVGGEPGSTAAGAAYNQVNYDTKTRAWVSEGAEIKQTTGSAVNVTVQADSNTQVTAVTPSAGRGASYGASMVLSNVTINNVTEASIDDEAKVTGSRVNVDAKDDVIAWSLTGAVTKAESAGVGLSIAMSDVTTDTQAKIADNDSNNNGGSMLTLTNGEVRATDVAVSARTDGRIESIAVAAAMASSADDDANGRPRSNATDKQAKADSTLNKAKNGIIVLLAKLPGMGSLVGPSSDNVSQTEPKFGIAVSGASAVNLVNLGTSAFIDGSKITLTNSGLTSLKVSAVNDTDITAATGSAALTRANNPSSTFSAGAAGSVSVNLIGNTTEAYIKDTLATDAQDVSVSALVGGEQLAVAIGAAVNASAKQDKAATFAGSVSVSSTNNTVSARLESSTVTGQSAGATQALNINAYDRIKLGTGGGSLTAGGKGGIGAAVTYSEISNTTEAIISASTVSNYKDVNVHAQTATKIAAGAAMVGVTWADNGATLGGAFVISDIGNTVSAEISQGSDVTTSSGGKVDVLAADTTGNANLDAVIDAKDGGQLNAASLDYDGAGIDQTAGAGSSIISVAGVGQVGASNIGLSFAYNKLHNQFTAAVHDSSIDSSTINVEAQSNAKILGIAAGVGVAKDKLAVSGSLVLNEINNTVKAQVTGARTDTLTADNLTVTAEDKSSTGALAGNISVSFGNATIGAAIAVNDTGNTAQAKIENVKINTNGSITVEATNNAKIKTLAATAGGSKGFALNGSASSAKINNTTEASILNAKSNNTGNTIKVTAKDNSEIEALSGAAAFATSAAVGIAVSVNQINNTVNASLSGGQHQAKNLEVSAVSSDIIRTLATSIAVAGDAGIAGSVAVNLVGGNTNAVIDNGADVIAQNNVGVIAESDHRITVAAGGSGIGVSATGVGVSVTTNSIKGDTNAYIDGATTRVTALAKETHDELTINTGELKAGVTLAEGIDITNYDKFDLKAKKKTQVIKGVAVNASSSQHIENISANIAGGGLVGVAATVSVNTIGGSTQAYIKNAQINQDNTGAGFGQNVDITAGNFAYDNSFIGNAAGGANAAGAGSDTHIMKRSTSAYASGGRIDATGTVAVKALSTQGVSSLAVGGAAGANALAATLSMALFTNHTDATVDGTGVTAAGLDISAKNTNNMYAITGAIAGGGNAIGGAFAVGSSDSSTTATLKNANGVNRVNVAGAINVEAKNDTAITHIVISGAGGGSAGVAGMADVNLVTDNTVATIDNSDLGASNDKVGAVKVAATHTVTIDSIAGALAGGGGAGIGAGASVNIIKANTVAKLNNSNVYASGLTEVNATSLTDVNAIAMTAGAGGTAGIGGAAVVTLIGDDVSGDSESEVNKGGSGTLSKVNSFSSGDKLGDLPNTSAISTTDKAAINADGNKSAIAVTGATGGYTFKTAAEVSGSSTITTSSLDVIAIDKTDTKTTVGGVGVGGLAGVGGGVAVTMVKANVSAKVSGATLTTSGDINVVATASHDNGKTIEITALAGGAGIVGIGAAVGYADISNNVEAGLASTTTNAGAGTISISAKDSTDIEAKAFGFAAGGGAVGFVISSAEKNSKVNASAGSIVNTNATTITAKDVKISAINSGRVYAEGTAGAAGLAVAGAGALVQASDSSKIKSTTGSTTTFNLGTGELSVTATATPDTEARAIGVAVSGGVAIGASLSKASVSTTIEALLGSNNTVNAGKLNLQAQQLLNGNSAKAKSIAAAGGALLGANATMSSAKTLVKVDSYVGNNSTLNLGGTANIEASADTKQNADSLGIAGGVLAFGFNNADASSNTKINAYVGKDVKITAATLEINAHGSDSNRADSIAGAGGVFSGAASIANTSTTSATKAYIEDNSAPTSPATVKINVADLIITADHTSAFNSTVNSVNASIVGASGAYAHNKVDQSTVTVGIGKNVDITAERININAKNKIDKVALGGFNVVSASGGLFDAAAAHSDTNVKNATDVTIGDDAKITAATDSLLNKGYININAFNDVQLYDAVKMDSGGAIAVARAESYINNAQNNADITIGKGTIVNSDGQITLETKTLAKADTEVQTKTYGGAGAAQGNSDSRINTSNNITLNGARLESDEDIVLRAGLNNVLTADAETHLWNRTLIPVETSPDAFGAITQNNKITVQAYKPGVAKLNANSDEQIKSAAIASVKDIYLQAGEGTHTTRGYGRGTDLYRELIAAFASLIGVKISLDLTGGSTSDNSNSSVLMNGTAFAGTHFHQFMDITRDANGQIVYTKSEGMLAPTITNENLQLDITNRINVLKASYDEYKDDQPDIANGFLADIAILEAKKAKFNANATATFIDIKPAAAYTGNITVSGDTLSGSGQLLAPGDAKIEIINHTNAFLRLKESANFDDSGNLYGLFIPSEKGGVISLNGVRVSNIGEIDAINQNSIHSGFTNMLDRQSLVDPKIFLQNDYTTTDLTAVMPEIHIDADISNLGGLVKIDSTGSVQVSSNVTAKTIDIATKGDFIKTFTLGFSHQGGMPSATDGIVSVVNQYNQQAINEHPILQTTPTFNYGGWIIGPPSGQQRVAASASYQNQVPVSATKPTEIGTTIAGNNVFISAEKLNINGVIQSGMPDYNIVIDSTIADAAKNAPNGAWIKIPQTVDGVALQDAFLPKVRWDGTQLELSNLKVEGGYMQLYGDIFSTGNGVLKVMDGYGRISVDNTSAYNLKTNQLDTGLGVAGHIKITDTSTKTGPNGTSLVTDFYRLNGQTAVVSNAANTLNNDAYGEATGARTAVYNPQADRRYFWVTGTTNTVKNTEEFWQTVDGNTLGTWDSQSFVTGVEDSTPRTQASWLASDARVVDYALDYTKTIAPKSYSETLNASFLGFNWKTVIHNWTEKSTFVNSIRASETIKIQFIGNDVGALNVSSANSNLNLAGAVRNLSGITALTAKDITSADTVVVSAKTLNMSATAGSIGRAALTNEASSYIKTNLQADGTLTANATGSIALWEQDGAIAIQAAHAGGIVNIKADGDLINIATGVAVSGSSVRLTSNNGAINGAIGSGSTMLVDTTSLTGNLSAFAAKKIDITESAGNLRLDSVTSIGGDVNITTINGSIIDDNSVSKVDVETKTSLLAVADRAGLLGTSAEASEANTVRGYNQAKQQEYDSYWKMRNVHKNSDGLYVADAYTASFTYQLNAADVTELKTNQNWTDTQVSQFEARQTTAYHKANQTFGAQVFNATFAYDVQSQDAATYQLIIAGSTWTESEITNRIAAGIFKDTADTEVLIENANVVGHNITLTANAGGIGIEKNSKTISFANADNWTDEERLALVVADRKDVVIDYDQQTITIRQKDDIDITLQNAGQLVATAGSDIYIGSEADIHVKQVATSLSNDVRIKSGGALINVAANGAAAVTGHDITIEAGGGNLGSSATPFLINAAGTLTARARGDMYVNNTVGDMRLEQVYATNLSKLTSVGAIVEDPNNHNRLTDIQASQIWLTAATTIGEADATGLKYLDIGSDKLGWIDMSAPNGIYVYSPSSFLNLRTVNASNGEVNINAVANSIGITGDLKASKDVTLNAGEAILFESIGKISSEIGDIALSSSGYRQYSSIDPLVAVDTTKYGLRMDAGSSVIAEVGKVTVQTGYDMVLASLTAAGSIDLSAVANVNLHSPGGTISQRASTKIEATSGNLTMTAVGIDVLYATSGSKATLVASADGIVIQDVLRANGAIDITSSNNGLTVNGLVHSDASVSLKADDDVLLQGGRITSPGAILIVAGTDGTGSVDISAATNGGNAIDTLSELSIVAANSINISGAIHALGANTLSAQDDIKIAGGSLTSQGAVSLTAGKDGTGSVNIDPAAVGIYAIDTTSSLDITATNEIEVTGNIRALGNNTLKAGDDIQLTGGSLASNGQVSLTAGTDGTGAVDVGAATNGGNAIYTPASLAINAADDINISGDIRADVGLVLNAVNGGVNMTGGSLSTGGLLQIASNDTLTIGGDIFGGAGVGLSTSNDVVFSGGSVKSNNDITIIAGTDGSGSIYGSPTSGVGIVSLGALTLQAPNAIGAGAPLVAQVTSRATLQSANINANISTTPLANSLSLSVSDIGGGPSANVVMNVASTSQITFDTFNVGIAEIKANTPSLQLPNGNITNNAVFNMPNYSTRLDTLSRVAHPGYDVNAFTIGGGFGLNALANSVSVNAFILLKNPDLQVAGNPPRFVENTVQEDLQIQQTGVYGNNPLQINIGRFRLDTPSEDDDDTLIKVSPDWLDITSQLVPDATEDKKEI